MTGRYLVRCHNRACGARQRTTANPWHDPWPEHCGQRMRFATTFEEERFAREATGTREPHGSQREPAT